MYTKVILTETDITNLVKEKFPDTDSVRIRMEPTSICDIDMYNIFMEITLNEYKLPQIKENNNEDVKFTDNINAEEYCLDHSGYSGARLVSAALNDGYKAGIVEFIKYIDSIVNRKEAKTINNFTLDDLKGIAQDIFHIKL